MKNCREEWYDAEKKIAVTIVDVTEAAQTLARGHLSGPTATYYLARALAGVALLGAETEAEGETVVMQMKCSGPLGGLNVECTHDGKLRGYTERKLLDDFDGLGRPNDGEVLGDCQLQVTRSLPGRILSQGVSTSLDCYLASSLQRKAVIWLEAAVSDEVEVLQARGLMVEALPDSPCGETVGVKPASLAVASRKILDRLGLARAELRRTTPLGFGCRCSPERAVAMLAALSEEERRTLPPTVDITCHMCGRTFSVKTGGAEAGNGGGE